MNSNPVNAPRGTPIQVNEGSVPASQVAIGNPGTPGQQYIGAQSVRAQGGGAGDAGWQQNLATFSGGQFQRPGGSLSFNPLSTSPFSGQSAATGGGNAPAMGSPSTLLQYALGMNPMTPPPIGTATPSSGAAQQPTPSGGGTINTITDWLDQFMSQGGMVNLGQSQ
jgi:hypothetical protein